MQKYLIVGAGFSGAVLARELAEKGHLVDVIDKREHIGGNCYDFVDDTGIRAHRYGPHIFHTNNAAVVDWVSRFGEWTPYEHKVKAMLGDGQLVTMPPNRETARIVGKDNIVDTLFRPYTKKMWDMEIEDLDQSIIKRVPIRDDDNELYFPKDKFQIMPVNGYTSIFEKIFDHANIKLFLSTQFSKSMEADYLHTFNCMPIDEYYDFAFGELPYRSLKFKNVTLDAPHIFELPTINFTNDGPYTRVTEWKNYPRHGVNDYLTKLTFEEPVDYRDNNMERYYPVKDIHGKNRETYAKYAGIRNEKVTFIGRCGLYVYIDMHQAINMALQFASKID
ncbi:MAG: UDP-galactopyranose mutase [Gammaproteobacteria bacterium]|nr:MAG: UDP-galactopyranose mutase [Gammaproteobacteria bacterium]